MFRHKNMTEQIIENESMSDDKKTAPIGSSVNLENKSAIKTDAEMIRELLEKNLKWSQIIYEQNRKINNKLMWQSVFGWLRMLLILAPLILAIWFLPPLIKNFQNTYGIFLGGSPTSSMSNVNSIDKLLKMLPLDPAKQEQLKALLK